MKRDQAVESVTRTVNQLDDQLAAGHVLEDIADGMKLRLIKIAALDQNGKTPDGYDPAELPDRQNVLKAGFEQGSGEVSPVLDDRHGDYTVVRTDEVTPAAIPPFETIKDRVTAAWKAAEQEKRAGAEAETIAKGMRDGKPASSFAAENGVEVRVSKPVSLLGDNDPDLPQPILPQILKLKKGEVIVAPVPGQQLVLRLTQLLEADNTADSDAANKIKLELEGQMPNEINAQYTKYLRLLFPVDIDHGLLDSLRQQGS
jgi:peptidyl-prolyl cis-trans isomerase D